MAVNYRAFLKLLEKWPVDVTKRGRDIGHHIREEVKKGFSAGPISHDNEEKCGKIYESLKRLSENHYGQLYKRDSASSASGLSAENCRNILSTDFLEALKEEDKGFIHNLFKRKG